MQDETYAERFRALGARPEAVQVTGSMKYDGAQTDRDNPATRRLAALAGLAADDVVFLAGSTQEPEESVALEVFQQLSRDWPQLRLIIVPRHPERFDAVARMLDASGVAWQRRTLLEAVESRHGAGSTAKIPAQSRDSNSLARVLLVDVVGELGAWWGTAHIAFVGGSLGNRGGQNMIEPAAYGAAVSFGPNTRNFRDIVAALLQRDAAVVVADGEQLLAFVRNCLANPAEAAARGQRAASLVRQQLGATERTFQLLLPLVAGQQEAVLHGGTIVPGLQPALSVGKCPAKAHRYGLPTKPVTDSSSHPLTELCEAAKMRRKFRPQDQGDLVIIRYNSIDSSQSRRTLDGPACQGRPPGLPGEDCMSASYDVRSPRARVPKEPFSSSSPDRSPGESLAAPVGHAIRRTRQWLLAQQDDDGSWCAELEGDTILESETILMLAFLGREDTPLARRAAAYLVRKQLPEGGWAKFPGGRLDISGSVKAYFALKLTGHDPAAEFMERARRAIRAHGGADAVNSFTRFYLALLGQISYEHCPAVPPEMVLLPKWFPVNPYAMSAWSRTIVVPLSIVAALEPVRRSNPSAASTNCSSANPNIGRRSAARGCRVERAG